MNLKKNHFASFACKVVELRPTWQSAVNVLRREVDELSVGLLSATIEAEGGGGRSVAARVGLAPVALTDQRIDVTLLFCFHLFFVLSFLTIQNCQIF